MEVEKTYVDSQEASGISFAFCHLLGFSLLPLCNESARGRGGLDVVLAFVTGQLLAFVTGQYGLRQYLDDPAGVRRTGMAQGIVEVLSTRQKSECIVPHAPLTLHHRRIKPHQPLQGI